MTDETRLARLLTFRRRIDADIELLETRIAAARTQPRRGSPEHQTRRRRKRAECGEDGGYYHHLRITHTQPCGACKAAHAVAERVRRTERAARRQEAVA